jgi:hypothetical protein
MPMTARKGIATIMITATITTDAAQRPVIDR